MAKEVVFVNKDLFSAPEMAELTIEEIASRELMVNAFEVPSKELNPFSGGYLTDEKSNQQFFLCDISGVSMKDDTASMDIPMFTMMISKPDTTRLDWVSKDGLTFLTSIPSISGRPTQLDKDLLIYAVSQLTAGLNKGRPDANNRVVRFKIYDYLKALGKSIGGSQYEIIGEQLERLSGSRYLTNVKTESTREKKSFGLIESYTVLERAGAGDKGVVLAVEITLSEWMFNSIQERRILTISPEYFRLKKPTERKLYEIVRRWCGEKSSHRVELEKIHQKMVPNLANKEFRRVIRDIVKAGNIPDYKLSIVGDKLLMELIKKRD